MNDETDSKILRALEKNARISYTQIARNLGLSEGAIRKRISMLEAKGIIKKYVVIVDPRKIGYQSITILGIDTEPSKLLDVAHQMSELDETKNVSISTGDHMIIAEIWAHDGRELSEILAKKIAVIDGVQKMCPAIILEKIKE